MENNNISPQTRKISRGKRERQLLSEFVLIEEEMLPGFVKPVMFLIALSVVGFIAWAGMTKLTEIATAPGEIVPSGALKVVQHLDGGIISEILATQGEKVTKGQVLLKVDGSKSESELKQIKARVMALDLRATRLRAVTDGFEPDFSMIDPAYQELIDDQIKIYKTQLDLLQSSLEITSRKVEQRQTRLKQLSQNLLTAKKQTELTGELLKIRRDLAERQLIDLTTLIETERADIKANEEYSRLQEEINLVNQELQEAQSRHRDTENQLRQDALKELGNVRAEKAELSEALQKLQAQVNRLEIKSPVDGLVHNLSVRTLGQVITPGEVLMQIVPDNVALKAYVRINPRDVGYVKPGQDVNLKIGSYDFTLYGMAQGKVEQVSASNITNEEGETFFAGIVSIDKSYLGDQPGMLPLQVGMAVDADILTGNKTLLSYLLKPVVESLNRAFTER